ncbi:MAG: ribonuclease H [uncultured bacterium (gcode 4)]|uniref:RNA-directed DNA polymerase n=1 Tax=uncultured bacterium (gcode 4) TaxID=1234023 RepID=K2G502_9BACT|nr:MAG: ribonuclease H [uncultured bacterium (gcode 4)]
MLITIIVIISIIVFFITSKIWIGAKKKWIMKMSDLFKRVLEFDAPDLSYTTFTIPKKDWTSRQIEAPNAQLKKTQQTLLHLLSNNIILPWYVTGFRKKFSIKTNAKKHVGREVVINLDIKDFFTNVTTQKLRQRLEYLKVDNEIISRFEKLCFNNWHLPQWAPTSPFLANFIFVPIDEAIIKTAKKYDKNIIYSRYADNITLSSNVKNISNLIRIISEWIMPKFGYTINSKVNLSRKHTRQTVTWITVNEKISMPRHKYMLLRAQVHAYLTKWTWNTLEIAWRLAFLYLLDKKKYWKLQKYYKKKFWETQELSAVFRRNPKKVKLDIYKKWFINPRTWQKF